VFAHRSRHRSPISGSVKYRVLTRARGRCGCCAARLLFSKHRISGPFRCTSRTETRWCRPRCGYGGLTRRPQLPM
jgi:hypothetical protein